jgi:predicted secreted protein
LLGLVNHAMSVATAIAIYFIIWWVVLFAVLPWGVRSQEESGAISEGTDPGAPVAPRLWWKLLWTTIVSLIVFALAAIAYLNRWLTIEGLLTLFGVPL